MWRSAHCAAYRQRTWLPAQDAGKHPFSTGRELGGVGNGIAQAHRTRGPRHPHRQSRKTKLIPRISWSPDSGGRDSNPAGHGAGR
jgi:hypothetical protein